MCKFIKKGKMINLSQTALNVMRFWPRNELETVYDGSHLRLASKVFKVDA